MRRELPEGFTVRYQHRNDYVRFRRPFYRKLVGNATVNVYTAERRNTVATVMDPDGEIVVTGRAILRPGDQFSRRLGREIALGRALKTLERAREMLGEGNEDPELPSAGIFAIESPEAEEA